MAALVLDASAAVRMVLSPAEHDGFLAEVAAASDVLAPHLYAAETGNTLWKYCRSGDLDAQALRKRHAEALALISIWVPDPSLFPEALALAAQREHSVYDCLYLVTARRFDAVLLTADRRLAELHRQIGG